MFGLFLRVCCNKLQALWIWNQIAKFHWWAFSLTPGPPRWQNTHARPTTTGTPVVVGQPEPCQAQWEKSMKLTTVRIAVVKNTQIWTKTIQWVWQTFFHNGLEKWALFFFSQEMRNGDILVQFEQGICRMTACRCVGLHHPSQKAHRIRGKTQWIKIKALGSPMPFQCFMMSCCPCRLPCAKKLSLHLPQH